MRLHYFCAVEAISTVEAALSAQLGPTSAMGPEGFAGTFVVPLSPNGSGEPTHRGGSSPIDDGHLPLIEAALPLFGGAVVAVPGVADCDDPAGLVVLGPGETAPEGTDPALVRRTWAGALALVGLQEIPPPPPF